MKKVILCLLAFTVSSLVMSQPTHVKKYYYWINKAELAICDSDFAKANDCYEKAFRYHRPLGRHLSTAYLVNVVFTDDTARIYDHALQLLKCGDEDLAKRYSKSSSYDTNIYNRLLMLERTTLPSFDTTLHYNLEKIRNQDQAYSHTWGSNPVEDSLNRAVIKAIYALYSNYNTINDYTAGLRFAYYLYAPGLHYVHSGIHDLQDLLREEVIKGNIPADLYMTLEDTYLWGQEYMRESDQATDPNGYGMNENYFFRIGDYLFVTYPENVKTVNRNRRKLGVAETFDDLVKKVVWQQQVGKVYWTTVTIERWGGKEDDLQQAQEQIQEIEKEHASGDFHRQYYLIPAKEK